MEITSPGAKGHSRPRATSGRPTALRWLVPPALATFLVAAMAVVPSLASAQGPPPSLPPISAQELLAKVQQASLPGLSGTLSIETNLGLPDLGGAMPSGEGLVPSLLTGDRTAHLWLAGEKVRVAFPTQMAESAIVHDGNDLWFWESEGQTVTRVRVNKIKAEQKARVLRHEQAPQAHHVAPTPKALAGELLAEVEPSTRVFVRDTATVAGRPAYELVLAPRSDTSLVADVVIAVDSETGLPLRVQVLARDSGTPALEVGFTSIDLSVPADDNFEFRPPPGATVTEAGSADDLLMGHGRAEHRGDKVLGPYGEEAEADPEVQVLNEAWETIVIVTPAPGPVPGPGEDETVDMVKRLGRPVSGDWGSGRLLHSSLVNVLIVDDGRVIFGPVTQAALEAAA